MRTPSGSSAIAVAALAVAFGGTAAAAGHYVITSTKQISPKVRASLRGARGATGAAGAAGAAGSAGAKGDTGSAGSAGAGGARGPAGPTASAVAQTGNTSAALGPPLSDVVDFNGANVSTSSPAGLFVMPFDGAVVITAQVSLENTDATHSAVVACNLAKATQAAPSLVAIGEGTVVDLLSGTQGANGSQYYAATPLTTRITIPAGSYDFAVQCARSAGTGAAKLYFGSITVIATG